jgi:hypothetical protein
MVRDVKLTPAEKCKTAWDKYSRCSTAGESQEKAWYGGAVWAMARTADDLRKVFLAHGLDFRPNTEAAQLLCALDLSLRESAKAIARMADRPQEPEPKDKP